MARMSSSDAERVPVADAVRSIISGNFVILESLKLKIVNYHGLASKIAPEVEELTQKKANIATIVVAIKRFSDGLDEGRIQDASAHLRGSKLELSGTMADLTVEGKASQHRQILQSFLRLEDKFTGAPYIFQLPNSVKIIAEEEDARLLDETLREEYETSLNRNVTKITIRLSPSAKKVPGIASFITELLYRNGVSVLDAFLSNEDVVLVIQHVLGARAYRVLSDEISK